MRKPLEKDRSRTDMNCTDMNCPEKKLIPVGITIINGNQEVTIKKEFISGFGYEVGPKKKKKSLEIKTFHQVINHELPRKKGSVTKSEIFLIGPNLVKMGKNLADKFEIFMKDNGLVRGRYQVKNVIKTI